MSRTNSKNEYFYRMISVSIIGSGNVAQHLISAFLKAENIILVQAFARDKSHLTHLLDASKITSDYSELKEADLYLIAVSDNAISTVSNQIPFTNKLVAHTSGSVAINDLNPKIDLLFLSITNVHKE